MVLRQGEWDYGPDVLNGGVRIERGPRGNSLGDVLLSILGGLFQGGTQSASGGISESDVAPSVSWLEKPGVYAVTPRLELRARHQERARGHVPDAAYTDPVEAWLALQQAERVRDLESSPENNYSVTKTVKSEIATGSEVREAFNPVNTMSYYEKSVPTMTSEYVGAQIAQAGFTDPNVTRWYPNSAELYEQELARVQAEQREQQMLQVMQAKSAPMPSQSIKQLGQQVGSRQAKKGELRIKTTTLGEHTGNLLRKITDAMLTDGFPIKLSHGEQALFSRALLSGARAGMRASLPPGAVGSHLHSHDADYNAPTLNQRLMDAPTYSTPPQEVEFQANFAALHKQAKVIQAQYLAGKIDSVEALKSVAALAAKSANNDTQTFVRYMDYLLIGKEGHAPFIDGGPLPRVLLGDKGYNEAHRDRSPEQSRHFWGFVSYGYKLGPFNAETGNIFHETAGPYISRWRGRNEPLGSLEDFKLSRVAITVGSKFRTRELTPYEFTKELDTILRTEKYKVDPSEHIWRKVKWN